MGWVQVAPGQWNWIGEVPTGGALEAAIAQGQALPSVPGPYPVVGNTGLTAGIPGTEMLQTAIATNGLPPTTTPGTTAGMTVGLPALLGGGWLMKAVLAMLVGLFGKATASRLLDPIMGIIATIIPGVQSYLGELPPGLGKVGGQVLRTWTAAGTATFAKVIHPTAKGFSIRTWCWRPSRQEWVPVRRTRNIVIGGKELRLAAALGHRRKIGKRRVLQILAQPRKMSRPIFRRRRG